MARHQVELGWTKLPTPCSRLAWVASSVPGLSAPELQIREQRAYLFAEIDTDKIPTINATTILQAIKDCVDDAYKEVEKKYANILEIITNLEAAATLFGTEFISCFTKKVTAILIHGAVLQVSYRCMWQ